MKKYTLYVGLNDKDTRKRRLPVWWAALVAERECLCHTDGATIYRASGIYKHENGAYVREKTLRIELLFVDYDTVKALVDALKRRLNQESIAVQSEDLVSELL